MIPAASPCRTDTMTRTGNTASAASKPGPWLRLFAISSPRDCGRSSRRLLMAQRLDAIELRCAARREEAEDHADGGREEECDHVDHRVEEVGGLHGAGARDR